MFKPKDGEDSVTASQFSGNLFISFNDKDIDKPVQMAKPEGMARWLPMDFDTSKFFKFPAVPEDRLQQLATEAKKDYMRINKDRIEGLKKMAKSVLAESVPM